MPTATGEEIPTKEDITLLNLLRCEPPTLAFDFFSYGGLTRSVFRLLQEIPNLEEIISEKSGTTLNIPCSLSERQHSLDYRKEDGIYYIVANTYNNFSQRSDAKFFARTKIESTDGKEYDATFLALEVYREKGNRRPVWELGFYITEKGGKKILYGEEIVTDVPQTEARLTLYPQLIKFIKSMGGLIYNPAWQGIVQTNDQLKFLNSIVTTEGPIRVISQREFNENRAKWFRYLTGTLDVEKIIKIEDRLGYKIGYRSYRIELVSCNLTSGPPDKFSVQILATTEDDPTRPNERELIAGRNLPCKGIYSHGDAIRLFLKESNFYTKLMYTNAEKGDPQFEIALDPRHIDFRYATIVKDRNGSPITITSWETPYGLDGRLLPRVKTRGEMRQQTHHYLQFWGDSPLPLRLDESICFPQGIHPRSFMGKLIAAMPQIEYRDGSTFIEQAISYGVPLICQKYTGGL